MFACALLLALDCWCMHVSCSGCDTYGMCVCLCACVRACVRACALVQVCVCAFGCCFVSANGLLVDACQCCCLLMFVFLPLSRHFPSILEALHAVPVTTTD